MKIFLDTTDLDEICRPRIVRGLEIFLQNWEKARESPGEIIETDAPKTGC